MSRGEARSLLGLTQSGFDPASRVRFIQFLPYFERAGWRVALRPNRPDRQWHSPLAGRLLRAVHYRAGRAAMKFNRWRDVQGAAEFDAVFVNRDLAGGRGLFFEKGLIRRNPRVVFDFDDAIYLGREEEVAWMCRRAAWVTPGNDHLAQWVRRHTDRVTVIPTVVDTDRYVPRAAEGSRRVRVGWSGSDQSIRHTLEPLLPLLASLQRRLDFDLVVITNTRPSLAVEGLRWSFVPWSPEGEGEIARHMDVGLMPLSDDEFQRGKCGLKLIQYMAAGLPTIASPVGVNSQITAQGETGLFASTEGEWSQTLAALVGSAERRAAFGRAGRRRCEERYSIRKWFPALEEILRRVAGGDRARGGRAA
jgi:glycosyltransferase involved in cell wall biosynthesis